MKALRPTQNCSHGFIRCADNIVIRVLLRQAHTGCLAMSAQHQGALVLRVELADHFRPDHARRPQFRNFHEEIHADGKKEAEARGKFVNLEPAGHRRPGIFQSIGEGEGQFLNLCRAGFLHVIAGDGNRVKARHIGGSIANDITDNPHAGLRRIDIGVAHHELFQDIILDCAGELFRFYALLFRRNNIVRQNREDGAVHGHGYGHFIKRNAVKQDFHILNAVNGHTGLTDITNNPRMIRIISAMSGQVESDGKAFLAGGKVSAIESVRFFGRGKTRILTDSPGTVGIHASAHAPFKWRHARQVFSQFHPFQISGSIKRFNGDAFRGLPVQLFQLASTKFLLC